MFDNYLPQISIAIALIVISVLAHQVAKLRGKNEIVAIILSIATLGVYFLLSVFFLIKEIKNEIKTQSKKSQIKPSNKFQFAQIILTKFFKSKKAIYYIPTIVIIFSFGIIYKYISHIYVSDVIKKEIMLVVAIYSSLYFFNKKNDRTLSIYSSIFATIIFGLISYIIFNPYIKESLDLKAIINQTNQNLVNIENQVDPLSKVEDESQANIQLNRNNDSEIDKFKKVLFFLEIQNKKQVAATKELELKISKIPLDTILLPQTITSENNIRVAANHLIEYSNAVNEYLKKIEDSRTEYYSQAENIYSKGSASMKAFDGSFIKITQLVTNFKIASQNLYDSYADMLLLMGKVTKANAVKIDNGLLLFSKDSDLNQYNLLSEKIKKNEEIYFKSLKDYDEASSTFKKKMSEFAK